MKIAIFRIFNFRVFKNLCAVIIVISASTSWAQSNQFEIDAHSSKQEEKIRIDVNLLIHAPKEVVWDVITDYGNATTFISSLKSSSDQRVSVSEHIVSQVGLVNIGVINLPIKTVYKAHLNSNQYAIETDLLSGDLESMRMETHLQSLPNEMTNLKYSVVVVPGAVIPNFLAEHFFLVYAKDAFKDLANEIIRRSPKS